MHHIYRYGILYTGHARIRIVTKRIRIVTKRRIGWVVSEDTGLGLTTRMF